MATQTALMIAPNLPGTVTFKLFTVGTDTLVATSATATKGTADRTFYSAAFTDVPGATAAGLRFRIVLLNGTDEILSDYITITNDTDTFSSESMLVDTGLTSANIDSIVAGVTAVSDNIQQAQTGVLTTYQYATWTQSLTGLIVLTGYDEIVMTLKRNKYDLDADSILKVSDIGGLQVLNGVAQTEPNTDASITVTQQTPTGELTLVVNSDIMASIPVGSWIDGFKKLDTSGTDDVIRSGKTIIRDSGVDETS